MRINELYKTSRPLSFEVFPPKKETDIADLHDILRKLTGYAPGFISVTHGAGGIGNANKTLDTAAFIQDECGVTALAHLTCGGAKRGDMTETLGRMSAAGIQNILALRGDASPDGDYMHACELIADIRAQGGFCVGAACYPEGHIDCESIEEDIHHLRLKQEAGADFLITQLFFDNDVFFRFIERARSGGVTLPVSAGVMPILGRDQIERMIFMCGASLPSVIIKLLHKYENDPASLRKAGIENAAAQAENLLARGAEGVHVYTMNKPNIARRCSQAAGRL